jgi:hypothetical protein
VAEGEDTVENEERTLDGVEAPLSMGAEGGISEAQAMMAAEPCGDQVVV